MSTREEIAQDVLRPIVADLKKRWMTEAVAGPLTPDGDQTRRDAALKFQTVDAVLIQLERAIKGI